MGTYLVVKGMFSTEEMEIASKEFDEQGIESREGAEFEGIKREGFPLDHRLVFRDMLETNPGDIIFFDKKVVHAAF